MKIGFIILLSLSLGACSVTNLRCGTDGETSYVDLQSAPQNIASNTREFVELCGFAYEQEDE